MCSRKFAMIAVVILALPSIFIGCDAARHHVGGLLGWSPGAHLDEWLENSTFLPGDSLEFVHSNQYNVVEVSLWAYLHNCSCKNPIAVYNGSRTEIKLPRPGTRYFASCLVDNCAFSLEVQVESEALHTTAKTTSLGAPPPLQLLNEALTSGGGGGMVKAHCLEFWLVSVTLTILHLPTIVI